MKYNRFHFIPLFILLFITSNNFIKAQSECKAKQLAKSAKANITPPYKYDSYAITEIVFDKKKEKKVEVAFTAFQGMKYKIIFLNSGFEEAVLLNIYDKNPLVKNRKKIYDSSQGIDNNYWVYDATRPGQYYMEYSIPPSLTGENKTGCIVMLIGYADAENRTSKK